LTDFSCVFAEAAATVEVMAMDHHTEEVVVVHTAAVVTEWAA
jgi:hypothetical protein